MRSPHDGEVGVDGLARDQQVHDLGGALEDAVDAQVAEHLLGGDGAFAAGAQRVGGLEAAAAADLDQFVGHEPGHLGAVELGEGGLDADVVAVLVSHLRGEVDDGLEGEGGRRDERDLGAHGLVQGDRLPHCSRSADHSRAIFRHHLPAPTHIAGRESRPVLRVVRAIFRPWPSSPMRWEAGTRTRWKRVTPFSRPRRPMKALRFSTVTPSESASTTKAVMPPRWPSDLGTRAMTTSRSATTPLVVHSFTPSST